MPRRKSYLEHNWPISKDGDGASARLHVMGLGDERAEVHSSLVRWQCQCPHCSASTSRPNSTSPTA